LTAVFWSLIACMLLAGLLVILRHLLVARRIDRDTTDDPVVAVFKQRVRELEQEQDNGLISVEQLSAMKQDLERTLLAEAQAVAGGSKISTLDIPPDWKTAGALLVLVPAIAIGMYYHLGQPGIIEALRLAAVHGSGSEAEQMASITSMVDKLAQRLQNNPDDAEGWSMLARSYKVMGRFNDAVTAYEHLYSLTGDEPGVLLQYADALASANGNRLSGKPAELIQQALKLSPDNTMGLWLAGMVAREQGDNQTALAYWQRLLPLLQNDADSYQEVTQLIHTTEKDLGMKESEINSPGSAAVPVAAGDKGIKVKVMLAAELTGKASPEDALFVYARATSGPPMPLAAVRKQVKDLPLELTLDDTMAMMPSLKISGYESVRINARISKSGTPTESSGDLVAEAVAATPGQAQPVELSIKTVVP